MSQKLSHQKLHQVNTVWPEPGGHREEWPEQGLEGTPAGSHHRGYKEVEGCAAPGHTKVQAFKAPSGGDWGAGLEVSRNEKRQDGELAGD